MRNEEKKAQTAMIQELENKTQCNSALTIKMLSFGSNKLCTLIPLMFEERLKIIRCLFSKKMEAVVNSNISRAVELCKSNLLFGSVKISKYTILFVTRYQDLTKAEFRRFKLKLNETLTIFDFGYSMS